ncbi:hypothetical protein C1752_03751 [Acaryochloris thomasi RCC1774]|uniref:Uncharacterized protein n=1 Tax=Acaryochloris thomasi RCC1774 TaxID=1764569 RepID=A0A2W1JFR3_9CYAN|nr:hypothetical protein [Acaryochloris thomasi]PZD72490.1 hypothetical protein C1752_03751 [Acaryochloris thomasi RCC1774]
MTINQHYISPIAKNLYAQDKADEEFVALLKDLSNLSQAISKYLGVKLTMQYWNASRPQYEWAKNLEMNHKAEIVFYGSSGLLMPSVYSFCIYDWVSVFVEKCSLVLQDISSMLNDNLNNLSQKLKRRLTPEEKIVRIQEHDESLFG